MVGSELQRKENENKQLEKCLEKLKSDNLELEKIVRSNENDSKSGTPKGTSQLMFKELSAIQKES